MIFIKTDYKKTILPFISIIEEFSIQKELLLNDDYRMINNKNSHDFYPLNEKLHSELSRDFEKLQRIKLKKKVNTKKRICYE